jgi:hypothetical protein
MAPFRIDHSRVSPLARDKAVQLDALRAAGGNRLFVDKASGTLEVRPILEDLLPQECGTRRDAKETGQISLRLHEVRSRPL